MAAITKEVPTQISPAVTVALTHIDAWSNEAAELAKGCPIFEFDGQVEVRPVMKLNM